MAGPYGEMYYIQEKDLAQAAEIVQVVPVNRSMEAREIRELMQAALEPLHGEIAALREEVEQLRGQLQLEAPREAREEEPTRQTWWKRLFKKK